VPDVALGVPLIKVKANLYATENCIFSCEIWVQGDQIGGIFAYWAIATLVNSFRIIKVAHLFGLLFSFVHSGYALILTKIGWARFWVFFNKLVWSPCLGWSSSGRSTSNTKLSLAGGASRPTNQKPRP
jgi:hypothetical protein